MEMMKRYLMLALIATAAWAGPKSAVLINRSGSMKTYYRDLVVRQLSDTLLESLWAQSEDVAVYAFSERAQRVKGLEDIEQLPFGDSTMLDKALDRAIQDGVDVVWMITDNIQAPPGSTEVGDTEQFFRRLRSDAVEKVTIFPVRQPAGRPGLVIYALLKKDGDSGLYERELAGFNSRAAGILRTEALRMKPLDGDTAGIRWVRATVNPRTSQITYDIGKPVRTLIEVKFKSKFDHIEITDASIDVPRQDASFGQASAVYPEKQNIDISPRTVERLGPGDETEQVYRIDLDLGKLNLRNDLASLWKAAWGTSSEDAMLQVRFIIKVPQKNLRLRQKFLQEFHAVTIQEAKDTGKVYAVDRLPSLMTEAVTAVKVTSPVVFRVRYPSYPTFIWLTVFAMAGLTMLGLFLAVKRTAAMAMRVKRVSPVLLSLACALVYVGPLFAFWQTDLLKTPVTRILEFTRGAQWIDIVLNSSLTEFPASNPGTYPLIEQLTNTSFSDFRDDMVSAELPAAVPRTGDDMGLYYIGYLVRCLGFRHFFMAYMSTVTLLHGIVLFAFCWTVFRNRAWLAGLAATWAVVTVTIRLRESVLTSFAPWQPYGCTVLFPLLLYVLLEYSRELGDDLQPCRQSAGSIDGAIVRTGSTTAPASEWLRTTPSALLHAVGTCRMIVWALLILGCAVLLTIRAEAILPGSVLCVMFFLERMWFSRKGPRLRQVFCALLVTLVPLLLTMLTKDTLERVILSERYQASSTRSHLFWHTIWCSLGEYPNELQFKWSDYEAVMYAERIAGRSFGGYSREYEAVLRDDIIRTFREHPRIFLRIFKRKLRFRRDQFLRAAITLVFGACVLAAAGRWGGSPWIRRELRVLVALTAALLVTRLVVLLSANSPIYYYSLDVAEALTTYMAPILVVFVSVLLVREGRSRFA